MERRVPPAEWEVVPGVRLSVSTMGGYSVHRQDTYIGYIHASFGDKWNAYVRRIGRDDEYLGKLGQREAVTAIQQAWDAAATDHNRPRRY